MKEDKDLTVAMLAIASISAGCLIAALVLFIAGY